VELAALEAHGFNLGVVGFSEHELADLLADTDGTPAAAAVGGPTASTRRPAAQRGRPGRQRVASDTKRAPSDRIWGPPWPLSAAGGQATQSL